MVTRLRLACCRLALVAAVAAGPAGAADGPTPGAGQRNELFIVSSTLTRPYVIGLVEGFGKDFGLPTPDVKTTLIKDAFEEFCAGIGPEYPDIVAGPRSISRREFARCVKNGILDLVEIDVGDDALVVVTKKGDPVNNLSLKDIWGALAAEKPQHGERGDWFDDFVLNTTHTWRDVNPTLPDIALKIIGPAAGTAIYQFVKDFYMEGACRKITTFKGYYNAEDRVRQCTTFRTDGVYQEIMAPIARNFIEPMRSAPIGTLAIIPFAVWRRQESWLDRLPVEGVLPTEASIAARDYVAVYPVRMYVKRQHMQPDMGGKGVVKGLYQFIVEATSEQAIGPQGFLVSVGLVANGDEQREAMRTRARRLERFAY